MSYVGLEHAVRNRSASEARAILVDTWLLAFATGRRSMRAVRHPLGFVCLPVHRDIDTGVCVHVWPVGAQQRLDTSEVHCHSWDLLSYVLTGTVFNQRFELIDTGDGPWRIFLVRTANGHDTVTPTDRLVDVKAGEPMSYHAGEYYEIPAGEFHSSPLLGTDDAVTVVLGRQRHHVDNLTLGRPEARVRPTERDLCGVEETRELVRQLLAWPTADTTTTPVSVGAGA